MNILFLSHSFYPNIGGIEANSEILATGFSACGHKVKLLTWTKEKGEKKFPFLIVRNPGVGRIVKEHLWADVVFENNPCMRLAWPGIFLRKPTVIALNTWVSLNGGLQGAFKQWWLKRAKKIIAVSNAVRKQSWNDAIVIGNPYNAIDFIRKHEVEKTKDFVFLGRLVSDKGAAQAIKAVSVMLEKKQGKQQSISLTLIGDGPERNNLEEMVNDLKLKDHVHFSGALRGQELATQLNRHRYLLVPSLWEEPFGNVVLEGLACGCLPIASNGGGLPDAVGNAGLLFERGNVESLVQCIESIYKDAAKEQTLRAAAAQHLEAHHPLKVTNAYLNVLQSVV